MSKLDQLQKEIHENAVAKGWWPGDRTWPEVRILIVSEIAEALEEFRAGRMATWYENGLYGPAAKPEGFGIELADAAIRILDYRGRMGWTGSDTFAHQFVESTPVPDKLDALVEVLYSWGNDEAEAACEDALSTLDSIARAHGVDLDYCMELKHAYNRTRPFRHGGKAA